MKLSTQNWFIMKFRKPPTSQLSHLKKEKQTYMSITPTPSVTLSSEIFHHESMTYNTESNLYTH